jgi:hypothetical protein
MKDLDEVDFRNYAYDIYGIDTNTLSGLEKYIDLLEELVCDQKKLKKIRQRIHDQNKNYKHKIK